MARKNTAMELANTMTFTKFKKLPIEEQRRVTSILVSAMNKRIKRLGETEIGKLSPTYQAYLNRQKEGKGNDGYYSIKDIRNSTDDLHNRFEALAESLKKATSVREWKALRNKTLSALNLDGIDMESEKAFWSMYRKFQEDKTQYKKYKKEISNKVLYYIARTFEGRGYDYTDKTRKKIMEFVKSEYAKEKERKANINRERSASVYVSEGDESE